MNNEDKKQFLASAKDLIAQGQLTREEMEALFSGYQGTAVSASGKTTKFHYDISTVLSYIGAGIILCGITFLVFQHWSQFGTSARLVITLGTGLALYASAIIFLINDRYRVITAAFYLMAAILTPTGLFIAFDAAGMSATAMPVLISALCFLQHFGTFYLSRRNIFLAFQIFCATWFFFVFSNFIARGSQIYATENFTTYRVLIVAISFLLLGFSMADAARRQLQTGLYRLGVIGGLGAIFALGGFKPDQNLFWELVFPLAVAACVAVGSYISRRDFLWLGSLALMVYIVKISFEYFQDSLGWPVTLILAGVLLIGIAYGSLALRRKYFSA